MNFTDKKILVTGGSSGIGKALISGLYRRGARSFAVIGRDRPKMLLLAEEFPEAQFIFIAGDLALPGTAKASITRLLEQWDRVDILINNAGVVSAGPLEEISDEDIVAMQNINVTGLILLTKHALPLLKESQEAAIINVSSGLGLIGMAFYVPYAATKAAVKQFSEALRRELNSAAIHVMTLYPTSTDTPMMRSANTSGMDSPEIVAEKTIEGLMNKNIEVLMGKKMMQNRQINFESALTLDKKLREGYEAMRQRATGHRSM